MNCRLQRRLVNCRSGHAHRCRWLKWLAFQIWRDIDTGFTWATTVTRERRLSFGMTRAQPKPSTRKILDHPPVSNLKGQTRSVLSIMTGYNVARDIFQPRNFRSFNTNSPSPVSRDIVCRRERKLLLKRGKFRGQKISWAPSWMLRLYLKHWTEILWIRFETG